MDVYIYISSGENTIGWERGEGTEIWGKKSGRKRSVIEVEEWISFTTRNTQASTTVGFFCKLFTKRRLFSNYLLGGLFLFVLNQRQERNSMRRWHVTLNCCANSFVHNGLLHLHWCNHFWQCVYLTSFAQWVATLGVSVLLHWMWQIRYYYMGII